MEQEDLLNSVLFKLYRRGRIGKSRACHKDLIVRMGIPRNVSRNALNEALKLGVKRGFLIRQQDAYALDPRTAGEWLPLVNKEE